MQGPRPYRTIRSCADPSSDPKRVLHSIEPKGGKSGDVERLLALQVLRVDRHNPCVLRASRSRNADHSPRMEIANASSAPADRRKRLELRE